MLKTFKFRIYPTKKQSRLLDSTLEQCRWLFNHLLAERKTAYKEHGENVTCFEQQATFAYLKEQLRPTLASVHSQLLQNVAVRVDLGIKAFFRRVKAGEKPGYPRFKGFGRYDSFTFPQMPSGCNLQNGRLYVSKVGHLKITQHRPIEGEAKTATLTRSSTGKWYVCFAVEVEPKRLSKKDNPVGIDVGLKTFATLSDATEIENPRFFRSEEKELAKAQRKLAKAEKGTKERRKKRKVVARVHERIKFKRDNFSHQHSRKIVDGYGVICVEDLHVNRMLHNHCLAKSISDAAWSGFFGMMFYKAAEAGRILIKINPAYTSQDCSGCGHRQKMPLAERVYSCPCCNLQLDRDLNASLNILRIGLDSLSNQPVEATSL